jgi:hypothetical protein
MRSFKLAFGFVLAASVATAQTYPSPTFSSANAVGTGGFQANAVPLSIYMSSYKVADACATDSTVAIQNAIDAAYAAGGREIKLAAGTWCAANLVLKNNVVITGENVHTTILKLVSGSTSDLFRTSDYATCMGPGFGTTCGPTGWGLKNITLDGNSTAVSNNNRLIRSYSAAMLLENVIFQNSHGICWEQHYPPGLTTAADNYDYVARAHDIRFLFCNQSGNTTSTPPSIPHVASDDPGGGALYFDGPSDSRFSNVFIGWTLGAYSLRIGPWGNLRIVDGEFWGGGDPRGGGGIIWPIWGFIGESATSENGTWIGVNLSGGYAGQALLRTGGLKKLGGYDYILQWSSSSTSLTIGTGAKSLTTGINLSLTAGNVVELRDSTNASNFMLGTVTSYTAATGALVLNATSVGGSGTTSSWLVGPSFPQYGYQIGESGWASASNYIDTTFLDIPKATFNIANSGGSNWLNARGYINQRGQSPGVLGTLASTDRASISVNGYSTYCTNALCAWSTYSPTVTSSAGTLSSVSSTGRYLINGSIMSYQLVITVTTVGTGSGTINASLPQVCAQPGSASGREDLNTGKSLGVLTTGSNVQITNYDYTFPALNGSKLYISGQCEI